MKIVTRLLWLFYGTWARCFGGIADQARNDGWGLGPQ